LIGQEILEHCRFRGEVMRVMFTAQDPKTIRDAFAAAKPNAAYQNLHGRRWRGNSPTRFT
jgi:DNA topoisomerase-3